VQSDVLLGDETGANARSEVFVKEASDLARRYILSSFEEATSKNGNGVAMRLDNVHQSFGKFDLILETCDLFLRPRQNR